MHNYTSENHSEEKVLEIAIGYVFHSVYIIFLQQKKRGKYMERLFKEYAEKICSNCINVDCETGKGIYVCVDSNTKCAKCTDYIANKEKIEKEGYVKKIVPASKEKFIWGGQ